MTTILVIIHIIVSLFLVGIVLLQQGKGASVGATLGGAGGSQTMFGSEGPMPLMNKITTGAAIIFMATSISLAYISAHKSGSSVMQDVEKEQGAGPTIERGLETVPEESSESADPAKDEADQEDSSSVPDFPLDN
ncbi:MAG: preprotein translocase subunit SecG [Desulfurivibrionaceae bacterium]